MGIKKSHARSMAEKLIPIPNEFYDTENKEEDLIADRKVLFPFTVFLNLVSLAAFVAFMCYYRYDESSFVVDTIIQGESHEYSTGEGTSWNCTPITADRYYKTRMNYDTCKEFFAAPDENNVRDEHQFNYYPFAHIGIREAVQLPHVNADVRINAQQLTALSDFYKAIFDPLKAKNSCGSRGLRRTSQSGMQFASSDANQYLTMEDASKWKAYTIYKQQMKRRDTPRTLADGQPRCCTSSNCNPNECDNFEYDYVAKYNYVTSIYDLACNNGEACCTPSTNELNDCSKGPDIWSAANKVDLFGMPRIIGEARDETSQLLEDTSPSLDNILMYDPCNITKAEAIEMYKEYITLHDPCEFAKLNAPYTCVRKRPRSVIDTFSLGYANSLLVSSVFSTICVKIFFATAKNKKDEGAPAENAAWTLS